MARKLRTFQTSQGFFDLAIAAPSMKAALEAWGANSNLFHQGFAREVDDPKVVAATLAKPGVVLRRPVGTKGPFAEHAELPTDLDLEKPLASPNKPLKANKARASGHPVPKRDDKAARAAALAYEKEQHAREAEKRRQEAVAAKKRERLERAVEKAQAAYDKAEREHEARIDALMAERTDLERRERAEATRWEDQRERLRDAVRKPAADRFRAAPPLQAEVHCFDVSGRAVALDRDFQLANGPAWPLRSSETLLTTVYHYEVRPGITLQPNYQFNHRPGEGRPIQKAPRRARR